MYSNAIPIVERIAPPRNVVARMREVQPRAVIEDGSKSHSMKTTAVTSPLIPAMATPNNAPRRKTLI